MATDDGGRAAFVARLQAHRGIAFKVAHAYARDAADRADLVQEIAVALWQAWPRYDAERPFSTWMYRVALNTALDGVRERARRLRYTVPFDETTPDVPDERVGPERRSAHGAPAALPADATAARACLAAALL